MLDIPECLSIAKKIGRGKDLTRPHFLKSILWLMYAKYLRPEAREVNARIRKRMSSSNLNVTVAIQPEYLINDITSAL